MRTGVRQSATATAIGRKRTDLALFRAGAGPRNRLRCLLPSVRTRARPGRDQKVPAIGRGSDSDGPGSGQNVSSAPGSPLVGDLALVAAAQSSQVGQRIDAT